MQMQPAHTVGRREQVTCFSGEREPEVPVGLENPPVQSWLSLAQATGGLSATDVEQLQDALKALPHRLDLAFDHPGSPSINLTAARGELSAPRARHEVGRGGRAEAGAWGARL